MLILKVAIACNIIPKGEDENRKYLEWDVPETVESIASALKKTSNLVEIVEADETFEDEIKKFNPDIVFNISEGIKGNPFLENSNLREAAVPFILSNLQIPCTGSPPDSLIYALNKTKTKEILENYGINVGHFSGVDYHSKKIEDVLKLFENDFPVIIKPSQGGTSEGISKSAIVPDAKKLKDILSKHFEFQKRPLIVEPFHTGKDYTCSILTLGDKTIIPPVLMIDYEKIAESYSNLMPMRDEKTKKIDSMFIEPADFDNPKTKFIIEQTIIAHNALGCVSYNRMDFKEGNDGKIYFLEMNPICGLIPFLDDGKPYSDFIRAFFEAGIDYDVVVNGILLSKIRHYFKRNLPGYEIYRKRFSEKDNINDIFALDDFVLSGFGKRITEDSYVRETESGEKYIFLNLKGKCAEK